MEQFVKTLKSDVEQQLQQIEQREISILNKAQEVICLLETGFNRLKAFTMEYKFKDQAEEILFFKEIKPRLFCNLIYYRKVYNIEMNRPTGSDEVQVAYLKREQDRIKDFFDKNLDFFHYYRSGSTYLDCYYFIRGMHDVPMNYESFYFERDPQFSTKCDFKVAKILANDLIQVYLKTEFDRIEQNKNGVIPDMPKERHTWTSNKIYLIELIYALEAAGCTNHGKLSIKEMKSYAEYMLNVDLGNTTRSFYDLCIRTNPTQFLDMLRDALRKRINKANGSK